MSPRILLTILAGLLATSCASTSNDYLRLQASAYENTIAIGDVVHVTDGLTGHAVLASAPIAPEISRISAITVIFLPQFSTNSMISRSLTRPWPSTV